MSKQYSKSDIKRQFDKRPFGKILKEKMEKTMGVRFPGEAGLKNELIDKLANKNELKRREFYRQCGWNQTRNIELPREVEKRIRAGDTPPMSYKEKQEKYKEDRKIRMANKLSTGKLEQADVLKRDEIRKKDNVRLSRYRSEAINSIVGENNRDSAMRNVSANADKAFNTMAADANTDRNLSDSMHRRVGQFAKPISGGDTNNPFSKPLNDNNEPAVSIKKVI
jgi:hypothetical protein